MEALYPALSAKERVLLLLPAIKEDRDASPAIRRTMPLQQYAEYHRLIATVNALNCDLATVILILHEQAEKVVLRLAWLQTMQLWSDEVSVLGRLVLAQGNTLPVKVRRDVKKLLARAPSFEGMPFDLARPLPARGSVDELARAVAFGLRDTLLQHWREVRAIEIVVEEVRAELDGEDPLHPDVRRQLDATKAMLREVSADFAPYVHSLKLSEPSDEDVALVRELIEKMAAG